MRLKADLHTHSIASGHGYSTITENLTWAARIGMELIAVTDHGPHVPQGAHRWYFEDLKESPSRYHGVRLLHGCEANLITDPSDNGLDIEDECLAALDFVQVGFHARCGYSDRDRDKNTEALLRVIANPLVDQVNHPGNDARYPIHVAPVVEAAARFNVILELNNHSFDPHGSRAGSGATEESVAAAAYRAGVPISVGSDAHYFTAIGVFDDALAAAARIGIPDDYFVNSDAAHVLAHLQAKRPRPQLDWGPVVE